MGSVEPEFDPWRFIEVLNAHRVEYVIVGGTGAILHGANYVTHDIDVCPATGRDNLERLSSALKELGAVVRVVDRRGVTTKTFPFSDDGESLGRSSIWNLTTSAGDIDLTITPGGTGGYDDLAPRAKTMDVNGVVVRVASLGDIIKSKRFANRDKDRLALPILEKMYEEFGDD